MKRGAAVERVAAEQRHLVWETGPLEGNGPTVVLDRVAGSGRKRILAQHVNPSYGLAVTAGWTVYANGGARTSLIAISRDGSKRIVLSHSLAAPFAARGPLIAWAEQEGGQQRVVVRDMRAGRVRLATKMPRCVGGRCYQLEQITLAKQGVVFTRDSTNPDQSVVIRERFSDGAVSKVTVQHDPQADLVPSSAGALYYALGRGWYRWDFGQPRPRGTRFRANPPAALLAYEHGRWFVSTRRVCDYGVVGVNGGGYRQLLVSPERLRRLVPRGSRYCVLLQAFAWTGRQALSAWALLPRSSFEEHSDKGLVGVGFASDVLR
ncbi:MAG TPA: hypothetical protein VK488_11370 [Gaiellaceae bacterium]|nr:hypothetical protein [Gaiellaceae bacterium]